MRLLLDTNSKFYGKCGVAKANNPCLNTHFYLFIYLFIYYYLSKNALIYLFKNAYRLL